ncbi:hypothetical protein L915_09084 [Phytophthora nicotianae]|uniref:Tc1-like transposase DDE domain-containing protein n=1 Tax=Phytophthora nicotianae TaxID=4792 RepID=W2GVE7_PHYNI|nr:hypothetical protein L915_09084 [Phytophthora nicotianae]ETL39701.1 hypothetical protein L916_08998 [Phytophthora nicotianae]
MGSQRVGRFCVRTQRDESGSCRNHILSTTARNIVKRGSADVKTRGGARAASTKFTPEMEESLVEYQEDNCQYRLAQRTQGRAPVGECAVVKLPPSKGENLQVHCAVSHEVGLVHYATCRGSIKMKNNAAFVDAMKAHPVYQEHFEVMMIVVVLDNAAIHNETEDIAQGRNDLELLGLGPYSPMCNPIKGCFSASKARIKRCLSLSHGVMFDAPMVRRRSCGCSFLKGQQNAASPALDSVL